MELDINTLRSIATVAGFVTFIGILKWAYSKRNAADFEEAANLPFDQDECTINKARVSISRIKNE